MIYVDVTDACQSPMNTGVQRVVRGIFRSVKGAAAAVTPLLWESKLSSYCTLAPRELAFLEKPFAGSHCRKAPARPRQAAMSGWSNVWRRITHKRNRIDLRARLTPADVLFMPEIFKDGRCAWLDALKADACARRVAVFHDAISWRLPELAAPANRKGSSEYMLALSRFDTIIAVSQATAMDLQVNWESQAPGKKRPPISIIGWPADELFRAIPPVLTSHRSTTANSLPKILCVGSLEERKNHLALLSATEQLWRAGLNFALVLIGRTTKHFGDRVLAEVKRLRSAGWPAEWRRHVDDAALLAAYDECAFTVFPSLMEGFGLPIMESLLRGRPCICGSNGALGEIAAGGCLTLDPADAGKLAGAIKRLLTDFEFYEQLCSEARLRRFPTWQDYTARLLPILMPQA